MLPYATSARFRVLPPPVACRGAVLHAFLLPCDADALTRLVQRELDAPTGGAVRHRALGGFAWLVFADLPDVRSTHPLGRDAGSLSEREVGVWVPIARLDAHGRREAVSFVVPFLWVDSGAALTAGREALGLPKELASIGLDPGSLCFEAVGDTSVEAGPGARTSRRTLVAVAPTGASTSWRSLLRAAPADALALLRATRAAVPLTQLRQIPDVADPTRAALCEVVELLARPDGPPRATRLPGAFAVRLVDGALHPLARALGCATDVVSPLGVRVELDFTLAGVGARWSSARAAPRPERLLVLGGGLGSLTAVFELTKDPGWRSRWDITVLQPGWRLGGKAASSRDTARGDRSEEHGLHVWFGFYRNAFRLVREVYDALDRPSDHPFARPEQVFVPQSRVCFHEVRDGRPWTWDLDYPQDPAFPGDPMLRETDRTGVPTPSTLLGRALGVLVGLLRGRPVMRHRRDGSVLPPPPWTRAFRALLGRGGLPGAVLRLQRAAGPARTGSSDGRLIQRLADVRGRLRAALGAPSTRHPDVVQTWIVAESALAIAQGLLADDLVRRGFDAVDGEDFRSWLARHEAPDDVLRSAPLKALYDAAFAYDRGDPARPDLPAGVALLTVLRMVLTYEGAILWKSAVGMGEAIVAPLYEVLAARGVRFRFFHRVDHLGLSEDGARLEAVRVTEQVRARGTYDPLVEVAGVPCWPSRPRSELLEDPSALAGVDPSWLESGVDGGPAAGASVLERGRDFDVALLGLGLGALHRVCGELTRAHPRWRAALDGLPAIRTAAAQVWLTRGGERTDGVPAIDNLPSPDLPSWIDMGPVLATESHGPGGPRGLVYGAGVLPDRIPVSEARSVATDQVARVLGEHLRDLAPRASGWDLVHDPVGRHGPARLGDALVRANVHGSELYERAASGTAHLRLAPDGSGVDGLVLAGVWTRTGFHIGSVEAAVMSGRLAATALDGVPRAVPGRAP